MFFHKLRFNYDAALRYYPVVRALEELDVTEVLEVGSGTNGISDYFDGDVIGVDSDFSKTKLSKNKNIKHIKSSITRLPFKANTFKAVVCLDTLEHVPDDLREKAVLELCRVTQKGGKLYLGFPTSNLSKFSEEIASALFKRKYKKSDPWLKEHKEFGLPDGEKIESILLKYGEVKSRGNVNIFLWLMIYYFFIAHPNSIISRGIKKLNFLFFGVIRNTNFSPTYRVIFELDKK